MSSVAPPVPGSGSTQANEFSLPDSAVATLRLLGSMKITITLFLLSMVIVFVGSLAQAQKDVWDVVGQYFRTWVAWIDLKDCFPPSMFPGLMDYNWDGLGPLKSIPFPGGWAIGLAMAINLVAAHLVRFRFRFDAAGILICLAGAVATLGVVWTGNTATGVEVNGWWFSPGQIWTLMLMTLGACGAISIWSVFKPGQSLLAKIVYGGIGGILMSIVAYFIYSGPIQLSGMRILWQLLKGTACAAICLFGCIQLFKKRAGIMVIHLGVALLMLSELQVAMQAEETQIQLQEGQSGNFLRDIRERELAIVTTEDGKDTVFTIPDWMLIEASEQDGKPIKVEGLPFQIRVNSYAANSRLRSRLPHEEQKSDKGLASFAVADPAPVVDGMSEMMDFASTEITLVDDGGNEIETLLCSQMAHDREIFSLNAKSTAETASVDGKDYQFSYRFQRNYCDYSVELLDVSRTLYIGSSTPKDFRSQIRITDNEGMAQEFTLWMNNPLRYKGETFYQTNYIPGSDGKDVSVLSVVRNSGWMLPYIACMFVAVGMLYQFSLTLNRFLNRVAPAGAGMPENEALPEDNADDSDSQSPVDKLAGIRASSFADQPFEQPDIWNEKSRPWRFVVPIAIVLLCGAWLGSKFRTRAVDPSAMNLREFARIPVAWRGRTQPIDSFAKAKLLRISHKSTFKGELSAPELGHEEKRREIIESVERYWPSADVSSLEEFNGEYPEWIAEVSRITSSGEAAVEERLRDSMIAKMPAVRWLLDTLTNPRRAFRHRVIRIQDATVLSKLNLEPRHGSVYSLAEIQPNLNLLEEDRIAGMKLEDTPEKAKMTTLQRRAIELNQSVEVITNLALFYVDAPTLAGFHRQGGLNFDDLSSSVTATNAIVQSTLKSQSPLPVPTGIDDSQRSWEHLVVTDALLRINKQLRDIKATDQESAVASLQKDLPRSLLKIAIDGNRAMLSGALKEQTGKAPTPEELKERAAGAGKFMMSRGDAFLGNALMLIGKAEPGADAEAIMAGMTDEEILEATKERVLSETTELKEGLASLEKRFGDRIYSDEFAAVQQPAAENWMAVLAAWGDDDAAPFNESVAAYHAMLAETDAPFTYLDTVNLESKFNNYDPLGAAMYLYMPVMLFTFAGWIFLPMTMHRSGTALMFVAFVVHTIALILRMYISGRPPVTNLYSSAIFIGWGVVAASFAIEYLVGKGIGNLLGCACGLGSLVIAWYLAEGDTMGVLVAVLDTTFWLATHVVLITLGYAATFLAGFLGMAYVLSSVLSKDRSNDQSLATLGKVVYGVVCFAVLFSLVGTVLGGLWADDSWGRFWGWDPKENGAMLIVIWNAIILHARWDKIVKDYGTAVLAMVGNIVTAWSWFGVNELSAGLHNYGFTEGRLLALIGFVAAQFLIILVSTVPPMLRRAG